MSRRWSHHLWPSMLLLLGTWIAFYQVIGFDFVNFDDPVYVTLNLKVQSGLDIDTLRWAFQKNTEQGHWHPLTWLSLALDCQMYGLNPSAFHLTNLLLHSANALLLFQVLLRSTGAVWRSTAVAALFAWHPLHVESVAWVTERKDVLSSFFWMLTMLAYVGYVRQRGRKAIGLFILLLVLFGLGLLAKPMVVTLPFVLLLWDYWPLGRFSFAEQYKLATLGRLLLEKVPLLLLALASSLWTFIVMQAATVRRLGETLTAITRLNNALLAYVTYLKNMVWPVDLAPYYPIDLDAPPTFTAWAPACLLAAGTLLAVLLIRSRPYLFVGWMWYVGTLVPVSGRWQAGSYTWADRYTYVPLIGVFITMVWGLTDLLPWRWTRKLLILGMTAGLFACLALTWTQVQIWEDSETLWTHTLKVTSNNFLAHVNLASALEDQGRIEKALEHYREAVRIYPKYAPGYQRLAQAYGKHWRLDQSIATFAELVKLAPDDPIYRRQFAAVLSILRREEEARAQTSEAERLERKAACEP